MALAFDQKGENAKQLPLQKHPNWTYTHGFILGIIIIKYIQEAK